MAASNITDPDQITRLICLLVAILSDFILWIYVCYAVFWLKEKEIKIAPTRNRNRHHANKKWNYNLVWLIVTLFCQFLVPFYNLMYRFIIPNTQTACRINDTIEEIIVSINRLVLLLFYIVRLGQIFEDTAHEISRSVLIILSLFAGFVSTVFPGIFIATQTVSNRLVQHFGVYCSNTGTPSIVITYFVLDLLLTIILSGLFGFKLRAIYRHETTLLAQFNVHIRNNKHNNNNKRRRHTTDEEREVRHFYKLKMVVKKNFVLTIISIVSSWLFIYHSIIPDGYTIYPEGSNNYLRWCYPLDYLINAWCVFLMFSWKGKLFEICDCKCFEEKQKYINAGISAEKLGKRDTVRDDVLQLPMSVSTASSVEIVTSPSSNMMSLSNECSQDRSEVP